MYLNKKFIYTIPTLLLPIITISCSSQSNNLPTQINPEELEINNADQFFPKMDTKNYYSLIKFEKHEPVISDELIKEFIKDVLKKVATNKGNIYFFVNKKTKQDVEINFKWEYQSKTFYKTYKINIGS